MSKWQSWVEGAPVSHGEGNPSRRRKSLIQKPPSGWLFLTSCSSAVWSVSTILPLLVAGSQLFEPRDGFSCHTKLYLYINHLCTDTPSDNDICLFPEVLHRWKNGDVCRLHHIVTDLPIGNIMLILTSFLTAIHWQLRIQWSLLSLSSRFRIVLLTQWIWEGTRKCVLNKAAFFCWLASCSWRLSISAGRDMQNDTHFSSVAGMWKHFLTMGKNLNARL